MQKLKPIAALVGLAAVGLAISGCYAFSGLFVKKSSLKPGKSTKVTVTGYSAIPDDKDVFFLLIGLPDNGSPADDTDDPLTARKGKFDTGGVVYNKPKRLSQNVAIRDELVADGGCGNLDFSDAPTGRFVVLASPARVKQTAVRKQVDSEYTLKQIRLNGLINPLGMLTAIGFWDDDGDGIPEANVAGELNCTGGAIHNVNAKVAPAEPRATKRDLLKVYAK